MSTYRKRQTIITVALTVLLTVSNFATQNNNPEIWKNMQKNFAITPHPAINKEIQKQTNWHTKHPEAITEMTINAQYYLAYVLEQTTKHNLPSELALIPFIESNYDPFAKSIKGAAGIWQLMPDMASANGLIINQSIDDRRDITQSTQVALKHLKYLHNKLYHRWDYAIAAYNAGEGRVRKAIRQSKESQGKVPWTSFLPEQTRKYLPKILALKTIINHNQKYQIQLPHIAETPFFTEIPTKKPYAFTQISEKCKIDSDLLHKLNPRWKGHSTSHEKKNTISVPSNIAFSCRKKLRRTPLFNNQWVYHKITKTDTLSNIAKFYDTTVTSIKKYNFPNNPLEKLTHLIIRKESKSIPILSQDKNFAERIIADDNLGPSPITHTVKGSDTIRSVAKQHQVKAEHIAYWNQLKYPYDLKKTKHLIIWKQQSKNTSYIRYIVQPGDNIYKIAKQHKTSMNKIKTASKLSDINNIKPNQVLTIPQ